MARIASEFQSMTSSSPNGRNADSSLIMTAPAPSIKTYSLPPFANDDPDYPIGTDQAVFHDTGPICRVPKHWERDYFLVDNVPVYYYIARAEKELGVKVGCSGLKSDRPLSAAAVGAYNDAGISVIMMALPNPGRSLNFMPYYRKVFEEFVMADESPVHTLFHKDLPKFLYGHSTGGQLLARMIASPRHKETLLRQNYVAAEAEAPFFEAANLSEKYNSGLKRFAFDLYACWNKNALPRETFGGLFYLHYTHEKRKFDVKLSKASAMAKIPMHASYVLNIAVKTVNDLYLSKLKVKTAELGSRFMLNIPVNAAIALRMSAEKIRKNYLPESIKKPTLWFERNSEFRTPTYGQIQEDQHQGRKTYKLFQKENRKPCIPLTIIGAEKDPFSCTQTTQSEVVGQLGAHFYLANGVHNSISEDRNCLQFSIDNMRPLLLKEPISDAAENDVYETPAELPKRWETSTSGNRFGNIFKSGARLLDPLTSAAKRVIGRSI